MGHLTDRLYAAWLRSYGGGAGRPARASVSTTQKAKAPNQQGLGLSSRNPIKGGSNHGFSQV